MVKKYRKRLKGNAIAAVVAICLGAVGIPASATADEIPTDEITTDDSVTDDPEMDKLRVFDQEQPLLIDNESNVAQCGIGIEVKASTTTVKPSEVIHFSGRVYSLSHRLIEVEFNSVSSDDRFTYSVPFDRETGLIDVNVPLPDDVKSGKYAITWNGTHQDMWYVLGENVETIITVLNSDGTVPTNEYQTKRYPGSDRYDTSELISQNHLACGSPIFVASGNGYADALSASAAAAKVNGDVVLANSAKVADSLKTLLREKCPSQVYVIGGRATFSDAIVKELNTCATNVDRIGGEDRYQTSEMIFDRFFTANDTSQAFIATGTDFPDALAASAVAGSLGAPILLVDGKKQETLPSHLGAKISSSTIAHLIVVGGEATVNANLEKHLGTLGEVERIEGNDRYQTALALSDHLDQDFPASQVKGVWLVSGDKYADALSAAASAGNAEQRLLLARENCLDGAVTDKVNNQYEVKDVLYIVGGTKTLTNAVEDLNTCAN